MISININKLHSQAALQSISEHLKRQIFWSIRWTPNTMPMNRVAKGAGSPDCTMLATRPCAWTGRVTKVVQSLLAYTNWFATNNQLTSTKSACWTIIAFIFNNSPLLGVVFPYWTRKLFIITGTWRAVVSTGTDEVTSGQTWGSLRTVPALWAFLATFVFGYSPSCIAIRSCGNPNISLSIWNTKDNITVVQQNCCQCLPFVRGNWRANRYPVTTGMKLSLCLPAVYKNINKKTIYMHFKFSVLP